MGSVEEGGGRGVLKAGDSELRLVSGVDLEARGGVALPIRDVCRRPAHFSALPRTATFSESGRKMPFAVK